jgi:glycosyltransferase involved in cell wall biosynthesis
MPETVSVALCTYNGGVFLESQLESIAVQTAPPAEVVACDDASTDGTVEILRRFAAGAPFRVRIFENASRLGRVANYEQAISACDGALIALADQDDVWLPEKLARLTVAIQAPGTAYAFCDARLIDEAGRDIRGATLLARRFRLRDIRQKFAARFELDLILKRDFVYGTTLLFRAEHRELVLPLGRLWSHDTWIVNVLASLGWRGAPVLESLMLYRQHSGQASGGFATPKSEPYAERAFAMVELIDRINQKTSSPDEAILRRLDEKREYWLALNAMQQSGQPLKAYIAAREVLSGRWRKYSPRTFR